MKNETPKQTRWELLQKGLQDLAAELDAYDKMEIAKKELLGLTTINRYLKGNGTKESTGKRILDMGRKIVIKKNNTVAA